MSRFRTWRMYRRVLPGMLWLWAVLAPQGVFAHGSVTPEDDLCLVQIGYYQAHFKIYLPRSKGHREYCEDLPDSGETVFVMEYAHDGLADVPIDLRIIRNVTDMGNFTALEDVEKIGDLSTITVYHHPAEIQKDIFSAIHRFEETGEFVGIITVSQPDTGRIYTAVFPFEVGYIDFDFWPLIILIGISLQMIFLWMNGTLSKWADVLRGKTTVVTGDSARGYEDA